MAGASFVDDNLVDVCIIGSRCASANALDDRDGDAGFMVYFYTYIYMHIYVLRTMLLYHYFNI